MSGAVDVAVVTVCGLVLDVTGVDGDLPGLLLRRPVYVLVAHGGAPSFLGQDLGDRLGESGLAVIDVADGADVDVGLISDEFVPSSGEGAALWRRQEQTPGGSAGEGGEGGAAHGSDWAVPESYNTLSQACVEMIQRPSATANCLRWSDQDRYSYFLRAASQGAEFSLTPILKHEREDLSREF